MNDREILLNILGTLQSHLKGTVSKSTVKPSKIDESDNASLIERITNTEKYMEVLKGDSVLERVLLILYVAKQSGGNDKFTTGEISNITKDLRRRISTSNVSANLGNSKNHKSNARYVMKQGNKYYLSMKGEYFLKEKIEKIKT